MPSSRSSARAVKRPVEYSILATATLCTLAVGAVMVYSASSAESLLQTGGGDPAMYLKRYVLLGLIGLAAMRHFSRHGLEAVRRATPMLLGVSFALTVAVMLPGIGVTVNGATRWLGAGPLQFQPSELLKVVARALHRAAAQRAAGLGQGAGHAVQAAAAGGGRRLRAAAQAARHGHGAGHLLHHRRAADRRGHPDAAAGHAGRVAGPAGRADGGRRALPDGAPHGVHRPVQGRRATPASRRSRRSRRSDRVACSASGSASRCRRSSTCPRPTRT